jgi:hypothetical protein
VTDDTDLSGLDYESARAYALEFLTSLKATDKALVQAREELAVWEGRAALAASKGLADLESAARAKADEARERIRTLEAERAETAAKVARIREKLPMVKATEKSVDADLLLAQLQMATGEALDPQAPALSELDATIKTGAADAALEELKRKLKGNS